MIPSEVQDYFEKYKSINEFILVNKFNLSVVEAKEIIKNLKEQDLVIETAYLLCAHCQSVAESGVSLEGSEVKFKSSYKCWSCKKKFNLKDAKVIKHFQDKQDIFKALHDNVFKS